MGRTWKSALVIATVSTIALWFLRGQTAITPPFAVTPFVTAFSRSGPDAGATVFFRKADGSYTQLKFDFRPPYLLLSTAAAMADLISGGVDTLIAAPAGPPNVGRGAQMVTDFAKFTSAGGRGVAYTLFNTKSSVFVAMATSALLYGGVANYPVGPSIAFKVIAADFNGDTVADLALTFSGNPPATPGGVAILINKGDGTFNAPVVYTAGISPAGFAILDVNHDNIRDLVAADASGNSVYVLLGNANGTFQPAVAYAAGVNNLAVTIADFNGDGHPDVAASSVDKQITILLGNGNGTFRAGTQFASGRAPEYLAAGDFDNDGNLDLVCAEALDNAVTVFRGAGNGAFQRLSSYVVSFNPTSLVVADYNRDGKLDVIVAMGDARAFGPIHENGHVDFLLGNGDGTFQGLAVSRSDSLSVTLLAVADFSGDGKPDAITNNLFGNDLYYFAGTGNGRFSGLPTTIGLGTPNDPQLLPNSAVVADFNGDGKPDLAVTEGSQFGTGGLNRVAVLLNNGSALGNPANYPTGGAGPQGLAAADLDGDGKADLAVANYRSGTVAILKGGGNGAFQVLGTYPVGATPTKVVASDLNGDSKADLIVVNSGRPFDSPPVSGAVYVLLNSGGGTFQALPAFAAGIGPIAAAVKDVNGDGKPDIVTLTVASTGTWAMGISLGKGDGTFQPATLLNTDFGPAELAVRDFDGDGKADIVVTHCCGSTDMTYSKGNGDGTFAGAVHFNAASSPMALEVADLNGDAAPDIVVAGAAGALTGVLNNAVVSAAAPPSPGPPSPAFGNTSSQIFQFTFTDPRGYQDLGVVNVLINEFLDGRNACYLAYSRPANVLYLVGDDGGTLSGASLGSAGSLSNTQCTVSWSGNPVSGSGNSLTLTLTIAFPAAFGGNKVIYTAARDVAENNSGWQALGVWKVPGAPQGAISVTGMSPPRGSGVGPAAYTFTVADTKGVSDLGVVNILINNFLDGRHGCYLAYARPVNVLFLVNDNGDALLSGQVLSAAGSIGNSQCTVSWGANPASTNGNQLSLAFNISFTPAFAGNRVFYMAARDTNEGNNTGWQAAGSWTVQP